MASIVAKIVGIGVAMYILAFLLPPALVELAGANVTGVDTSVVTILQIVLPLLAIIGIAMYFLPGSQMGEGGA